MKSKLLFHGIEVPFSETPYWSGEFREWIRGFSTKHETLRKSFDPLIGLYEELTVRIREITRDVVALSLTKDYHDRVNILTTVPGIGTVTAMEILVELPRIERFRTHEELASYLGLTPSEYSVLAQLSVVLLRSQPSNVKYMTVIIDFHQNTQKDNQPSDKYLPE